MRVRNTIQPILACFLIASLFIILHRSNTSITHAPKVDQQQHYPPIQLFEDKIMYNAIVQRIEDEMMLSANDPVKLGLLQERMERLNRNWVHVEDPNALKFVVVEETTVAETKAEKKARKKASKVKEKKEQAARRKLESKREPG
jgi:hypothetical protein